MMSRSRPGCGRAGSYGFKNLALAGVDEIRTAHRPVDGVSQAERPCYCSAGMPKDLFGACKNW